MQLVNDCVIMYDTMKDKRIGMRRGDREVRRAAGEGDRGAGADRRFHRQRAGRAGHRREDRGAADRRIRRSRNAAQARRRDQAGQAPADADRQRRNARASRRSSSRSTRHVPLEVPVEDLARARAGLQEPDRLPQGDGVHDADAARRREVRHRGQRDRGGRQADVRQGGACARSGLRRRRTSRPAASGDLFAPPPEPRSKRRGARPTCRPRAGRRPVEAAAKAASSTAANTRPSARSTG